MDFIGLGWRTCTKRHLMWPQWSSFIISSSTASGAIIGRKGRKILQHSNGGFLPVGHFVADSESSPSGVGCPLLSTPAGPVACSVKDEHESQINLTAINFINHNSHSSYLVLPLVLSNTWSRDPPSCWLGSPAENGKSQGFHCEFHEMSLKLLGNVKMSDNESPWLMWRINNNCTQVKISPMTRHPAWLM